MIEVGYEAGKFLVQKIAPKIIEKLRERAMKNTETPKGIVIVNASGHPLSEKAEQTFKGRYNTESILNIKIPNVDIEDLVKYAEDIVNQIANYAGKKLLTGEYVLVPMGFSPLALVTLAMLHGITGHFPPIHPLKKGEFGFIPADALYDLYEIRTNNRNNR